MNMLANRWINLGLYIVASTAGALMLVELPALAPYTKALGAFSAALLAVARWDKVIPSKPKKT
jgi:hypothetical protein